MEKKIMKLTDYNGKETEYEILCTFTLASTLKNYLVYTDNTYDNEGNLTIFASIYDETKEPKLEKIETEEEWRAVEYALEMNNHREVTYDA